MKYMGSKNRIAKYIIPIMLAERKVGQWWVEPFVGGGNIIDKIEGKRLGADLNHFVIDALGSIRDYIDELPKNNKEFTEEDYNRMRSTIWYKDVYTHRGYLGFTCSFGAKWGGVWARDRKGNRDFMAEAYKNALKQSPRLQGVKLVNIGYRDLGLPPNSLIYCDPPYQGCSQYLDKFDSESFFQWCRDKVREGHTVFVSEYDAPKDFECIYQREIISSVGQADKRKKVVEKLFRVR